MKLTYWVAHCLNDSPAYSIRCRTKREVLEQLRSDGSGHSKPYKIIVEYSDSLDLLQKCLGEGGLSEEESSRYEAEPFKDGK